MVLLTDIWMDHCQEHRLLMFFKIGILNYFVIFTGKSLYWSLFLIKLQVFWPGLY